MVLAKTHKHNFLVLKKVNRSQISGLFDELFCHLSDF